MDGRLAQTIIPAKIIDEQPNHIIGSLYGMIPLEARRVRSGQGEGIHYILWNARFPHMPLVNRDAVADPRDSIPWVNLEILKGADPAVFVASWKDTKGKELVSSAFKIEPVEAEEPAVDTAEAANTNSPGAANG